MEELSEQEQWERLKGWVRSNGPQVIIMVAVMLLGWFGWKWWQTRGQEQQLASDSAYQAILVSFDDDKLAEALAQIEALRSKHPKSPYVSAADMVAARVFVESNQLDKAVERLERVASSAQDDKLRPVAQLRLARVQAAQGKYDVALATLGSKALGAHEPARLETRGDILLAKGDRAAALAEYEAASKLQPAGAEDAGGEGSATELLQLKIADLKGNSATPAAATPAAPAALAVPTPAPAPAPAAAPAVAKP